MRIPSLDGLRAISIVLVLFGHLRGTTGFPIATPHGGPGYANFGVRVFFVISGFLITTLLMNEHERTGDISLKKFYIRRAYRILPAAYCYLLVAIVFSWSSITRSDLATALTYTINFKLDPTWVLGHLWSLSVEEQFYLLWPWAVAYAYHWRRELAIAAIVVAPLLRCALWAIKHPEGTDSFFPTVCDALATGCLLALLQPELRRYEALFGRRAFAVVPILTALLLFTAHYDRFYQSVGLSLMHVGIALSIHQCVVKRYWILNARPVVWLGTLSYSLYLFQQPFLNRNSTEVFCSFPLNLGLALGCACLCHYFVEKPMLELRAKRQGLRTAPDVT